MKNKPKKKKIEIRKLFVKIVPKVAMENENLRNAFKYLNKNFFGDRLPAKMRLCYMANCGYEINGKWHNVDGYFDPNEFAIFVEQHLSYSHQATTAVLIHEMAHADLHMRGYEGYEDDKGHGMMFQGELVRLLNAGAFDGVL